MREDFGWGTKEAFNKKRLTKPGEVQINGMKTKRRPARKCSVRTCEKPRIYGSKFCYECDEDADL